MRLFTVPSAIRAADATTPMLAQDLEQLSTELKEQVMFGAVDIGDYPEAGETWQVTTLPTLLIFKQGVLKETLRGYQRTHLITQALKRIAIQTPQTSKVNNARDS